MRSNDKHVGPRANEIRLNCPAKVNLALSVGPPNRDGLHPIASWMVAVEFCDTLVVRPTSGSTSTFRIKFADDAPTHQEVDWPIERDLTYLAHRSVLEHLKKPLPIEVILKKRIPAGSGLGGGSSNAAAMLWALNQLFFLQQNHDQLNQFASKLGSDVAFFISALEGKSSAIVTGTGEKIEPAPARDRLYLVLILPPVRCPTPQVYAALDQLDSANPAHKVLEEQRVRHLAAKIPLPHNHLFNDLTEPAIAVTTPLGALREKLHQRLEIPVHVTGSGSAMFILANSASEAIEIAHQITTTTGLPAVATSTI